MFSQDDIWLKYSLLNKLIVNNLNEKYFPIGNASF